jgi:hypothetical protein
MVRNSLILRALGIRPKTIIHIGAGSGEDRDLYFKLGANKLIWVEASYEKYLKITERYPKDTVLNFYVTDDPTKDLNYQMSKEFDLNKPTQSVISDSTPHSSLDQIFSNLAFDLPILLVVDTDGAEVDILSGGDNFLKSVSYLVIEQHYHWDKGEWHKEISRLCSANGFYHTLSRPSHTNEYEDALWTRFSTARIHLSKILDSVFLLLKQYKHIAYKKHWSTTYFNCEKCNKLS